MPDSNVSPDPRAVYPDLAGKVCVITGGSGILGSAYCEALAAQGATVICADVDSDGPDRLATALAGLPGLIAPMSMDLSSETSVQECAARILDKFGPPDVLVNNAATKTANYFAPLEQFRLEEWNQALAVNVTGVFLTCRAFVPAMTERGRGSIVNISSIYGVVGPDPSIYEGSWYEALGGAINTPLVYSTSKAAILGITRHLATCYGKYGLRSNAITPGGVESGQNEVFLSRYSAKTPLGRMARRDEIVSALLYLASDVSSYVTGHNLVVDGGWTAW